MKKKGLLRITAGLSAIILSGATLVACGEDNNTTTNNEQKEEGNKDIEVDTSAAKITNKEALQEDWGVNGGTRSIQTVNSLAKLRSDGYTVEFTSSDVNVATIDDAGKITPIAAGKVTFTIKLNGKVADTVEVTLVKAVYQSIESVTKAILENKGDTTPVYSFKGTVSALIGTKAFTVQEGDYAIYIYADPSTVVEGHALAVGDVVEVTTHAQLYNGLVESKTETTVKYLADETGETINAKAIQNKDLTDDLQSVKVNVANLTAVGALIEANSSTYGVLQVTDGTSDKVVTIYVNKYLPSDTLTAINEKLTKLANEAFTANLNGVIVSKYNDFQYLVTDASQIELVAAAAVNPTKVEVANLDAVQQLIVGNTGKIEFKYEPENCNAKAMTFESSDATVATVDDSGKITALKAGTTKITCTSVAVNTIKAEFDLTVISPKFVVTPIVGEEYYIAFDCSAGVCYFNGEMDGYYGKTVPSKEDAVKFVVEKGTGDNDGKFALKASNGKYIDIEVSGTHVNFKYVDTAAYLSYDKANFCYYKTIDGKNYYFGTYSTYATVSAGEGVRTYPARFYPVYMNEAPAVGSTIKMGTYHYNLETPGFLYLDGTLDGTYFKTTTSETTADTLTVEQGTVEGRYALKTSAGKYIAREQQESGGKTFYACTLADAKSEATDLVWNAANMTFQTIGVDPGKCIGTSGTKTFTTLGYSLATYSDMCWTHAYLVSAPLGHGESETDPLTVAEALELAGALKDNTSTEKVYYIKGKVAKIATAFSMQYGNVNVYVTDDGVENQDTTKMFEFYKLSGLNSAKLMSEYDIEVGDVVVTKQKIKKYVSKDNAVTYETADACPTVSIVKANNEIRGIAVDKEEAKIEVGGTAEINAAIAPTTLGKDISKIVWTVSDETVGTLNTKAGGKVVFTGAKAGEATLTATWTENDPSSPVLTKTVKITVEGAFEGAKLDFNGSSEPTVKGNDKVEWTINGVVFTVAKGESTTPAGGDKQGFMGDASTAEIRLYKNQVITVTPPEGKTISYIEIGVTNNSSSNLEGSTYVNGTIAKESGTGNVGLANPFIYKLTPTDGTKSVSITAKAAFRFSYIKVVLA